MCSILVNNFFWCNVLVKKPNCRKSESDSHHLVFQRGSVQFASYNSIILSHYWQQFSFEPRWPLPLSYICLLVVFLLRKLRLLLLTLLHSQPLPATSRLFTPALSATSWTLAKAGSKSPLDPIYYWYILLLRSSTGNLSGFTVTAPATVGQLLVLKWRRRQP